VVLRRIERAHTTLGEQVLGQPQAVRAASDILARAAVGLAGAQAAGHSSRPQGVMFFAGPTGVGKTELAKQIAALVFGREDAMVRFDMSEFSAEHTEARLLGAPPGYVGHEAGGELTNAVRTRPFSLLLFDEIEKANRRILDKFLQILEDGRLTDGAGSTVHFGETLIVFTSNLGVLETDVTGNQAQIPYRTTYETLRQKVSTSIRHEFVALTNRPELLNRIGDNIVVFDYIRPETAIRIAHRNLENLAERVRATRGARLAFGPDFLRAIDEAVTAEEVLVNGGRGVGSLIESRVVNPLARHLLNEHATRLEITSFGDDASGHHLTVVAAGRP
jgi:ATP-dependent Clp protease ATP-binding subunit ClpA